MICECATVAKVEEHTLVDEKCTVCGFDATLAESESVDEGDFTDVDFYAEEGCESALGASSVVLCVSAALVGGFALKKKKKD